MSNDIQQLKKSHHALIARYIDVLNQVSKLPFFVSRGYPMKVRGNRAFMFLVHLNNTLVKYLTLRYMVRLLVESHIKAKFMELSVAYSYMAQQNPEDEASVSWLHKASGDCDKLAHTLKSWQSIQGFMSALTPLGIGLATAWLGLDNIYGIVNMIQISAISLITFWLVINFSVYFMLLIVLPFQRKREMLGGPLNLREEFVGPVVITENSIYYLENQLFQLAGRGKVREIPIDIIYMILSPTVVGFSVIMILRSADSNTGMADAVGIFLYLLLILQMIVIQSMRLKRRREAS